MALGFYLMLFHSLHLILNQLHVLQHSFYPLCKGWMWDIWIKFYCELVLKGIPLKINSCPGVSTCIPILIDVYPLQLGPWCSLTALIRGWKNDTTVAPRTAKMLAKLIVNYMLAFAGNSSERIGTRHPALWKQNTQCQPCINVFLGFLQTA